MSESIILRSNEIIDNLTDGGFNTAQAYAWAFGACWAWLDDETRLRIIESSKARVENDGC